MASAPSVYEHFLIMNPHLDMAKPFFPFCKLRMKGPESMNILCFQWKWWQERAKVILPTVRIKYKTRTKTPPIRKMPLHPAQCWHSVEDFPEAQVSRCYTYQVQMPQANPSMKAWELYHNSQVMAYHNLVYGIP